MKGIDTLAATTIVVEVCDFRQFAKASSFMIFTGLVPSEDFTGERIRRGSITKAGNAHVRRVLVEAAWANRHRPAVGCELRRRQAGQRPRVIAHSWAAQLGLCTRFRKLSLTKESPVVAVSIARELAGFIWALMNDRHAA
jgi:transposase